MCKLCDTIDAVLKQADNHTKILQKTIQEYGGLVMGSIVMYKFAVWARGVGRLGYYLLMCIFLWCCVS